VASVAEAPPSDRRTRRRELTREKLLRAARGVFARKGIDNTRINEITEAADVGFGSFYNHFDSKEAIVEAVLAETVSAQAAAVDRLTKDLDDPAEVVSVAHRFFVRQASFDPDWAWLLIRLESSHDVALAAMTPFALRDLERAVTAGRFQVSSRRVALAASGGALLSVMRAVLDGRAPKDADVVHAEGVLRLFGLPAVEAAEVARRPLPAEAQSP
jgi:AcrR family transcriptional regulator